MAFGRIFEKRRGSGVWWVDYRDSAGVRHREKAEGGRKKAAHDLLAKRLREVAKGEFSAPRSGGRLTFRKLAIEAMKDKKLRIQPLSYKTDVGRLERLYPLIGNIQADRLSSARIRETLAQLRTGPPPLQGSTANRFLALISSIYKFAVENGRTAINPAAKLKRFKENPSRDRWLPKEELEEKLRFEEESDLWEFLLALFTGIRRGEQFDLKWSDVDLPNKRITVSGKTGRRYVPLNSEAAKALESLRGLTGKTIYVSPDKAEETNRDYRRWFHAACKKAGISNFRWHDLRHTYASRGVINGVTIPEMKDLLGHKDIKTTMKYAHLAPGHLDVAVEKMVEA